MSIDLEKELALTLSNNDLVIGYLKRDMLNNNLSLSNDTQFIEILDSKLNQSVLINKRHIISMSNYIKE